MRFVPTAIHALLDYPMGILLIALPWLGDFADQSAAMYVPIFAGIAMLGLSFLTDYEFGAVRVIPVPAHLAMDAGMGIFLAASPWLFGFADQVWMPHLLLGIGEVGAAVVTELQPRNRSVRARA